jgi:hypothetical protein
MSTNILYIDNNKALTDNLIKQFKHTDVTLITAKTGIEGVELAKTCLPQVVLMEVRLPDIDGVEVMMRLRDNPLTANIPVVMLTSHISSRTRRYAERMGCNAYLIKPVNTPTLFNTLQPFLSEQLTNIDN